MRLGSKGAFLFSPLAPACAFSNKFKPKENGEKGNWKGMGSIDIEDDEEEEEVVVDDGDDVDDFKRFSPLMIDADGFADINLWYLSR